MCQAVRQRRQQRRRCTVHWGNRRNGQYGCQGNSHRNNHLVGSTTKEDAETAPRLFAALHHFHLLSNNKDIYPHDGCGGGHRCCRDGRDAVLTNGMFLHVVDALARSTNPKQVHLADALLRQLISLCMGRRDSNCQAPSLGNVGGARLLWNKRRPLPERPPSRRCDVPEENIRHVPPIGRRQKLWHESISAVIKMPSPNKVSSSVTLAVSSILLREKIFFILAIIAFMS